nr:Surface protein Pls [Moritella viscosa]
MHTAAAAKPAPVIAEAILTVTPTAKASASRVKIETKSVTRQMHTAPAARPGAAPAVTVEEAPSEIEVVAPFEIEAPTPLDVDVPFEIEAPTPLDVDVPFEIEAPAPLDVDVPFEIEAPAPLDVDVPFEIEAPAPLGIDEPFAYQPIEVISLPALQAQGTTSKKTNFTVKMATPQKVSPSTINFVAKVGVVQRSSIDVAAGPAGSQFASSQSKSPTTLAK